MKALFAGLAVLSPLAAAEPNTLTDDEANQGFELLFDGKSLDGWRTYQKEEPDGKWKVVNGAITLTEKGGGDLITTGKFKNFELRLEFKIAPEGNSGIMWHVAEIKGPPYLTGPEYQILDSTETPDHQYAHEFGAGNLAGCFYGFTKAKPEWSKPAGEWNEARIRVDGTKVTFHLNGHLTAEIDSASDEYKETLAKSKFADWKQFNVIEEGYICFQDHGDRVSFRSIRLLKLD